MSEITIVEWMTELFDESLLSLLVAGVFLLFPARRVKMRTGGGVCGKS
jgi:hypothetical protein